MQEATKVVDILKKEINRKYKKDEYSYRTRRKIFKAMSLQALNLSIWHWEENLVSEFSKIEIFSDYCPMCYLNEFLNEFDNHFSCQCGYCLIGQDSDNDACQSTPWIKIYDEFLFNSHPKEIKKLCKEELNYLKGLKEKYFNKDGSWKRRIILKDIDE